MSNQFLFDDDQDNASRSSKNSLQVAPYQNTPPYSSFGQPYMAYPTKDRSFAIILELLPALFGFLGIGWIYAGDLAKGITLLIGFWIWLFLSAIIVAFTAGLGCCCTFPLSFMFILLSISSLNNYTRRRVDLFRP